MRINSRYMMGSHFGRHALHNGLRRSWGHFAVSLFALLTTLCRATRVPGLESGAHFREGGSHGHEGQAVPTRTLLQEASGNEWSVCFDGIRDAMRVYNPRLPATRVIGISMWVKMVHPTQQPGSGELFLLEMVNATDAYITNQ